MVRCVGASSLPEMITKAVRQENIRSDKVNSTFLLFYWQIVDFIQSSCTLPLIGVPDASFFEDVQRDTLVSLMQRSFDSLSFPCRYNYSWETPYWSNRYGQMAPSLDSFKEGLLISNNYLFNLCTVLLNCFHTVFQPLRRYLLVRNIL